MKISAKSTGLVNFCKCHFQGRGRVSSSLHIDNNKKNILILGIGPTQGLNNPTLTAEAQYSINISR